MTTDERTFTEEPTTPEPDARDGGAWYWNPYGAEWRWCADPESDRCGGSGYHRCYCGGDLCVCANDGSIDCDGCEDCDRDIDDGLDESDFCGDD